jgi:hypothetical protein
MRFITQYTMLTSCKAVSMKVMTKSGEIFEVTSDHKMKEGRTCITNVWLKGGGKVICKDEYY